MNINWSKHIIKIFLIILIIIFYKVEPSFAQNLKKKEYAALEYLVTNDSVFWIVKNCLGPKPVIGNTNIKLVKKRFKHFQIRFNFERSIYYPEVLEKFINEHPEEVIHNFVDSLSYINFSDAIKRLNIDTTERYIMRMLSTKNNLVFIDIYSYNKYYEHSRLNFIIIADENAKVKKVWSNCYWAAF